MSNWPKTREADLEGLDLADSYELTVEPGKYDFTLTASQGGKVHLRIRYHSPALIGESGNGEWYTIREIDADTGARVQGTFEVPKVRLSSEVYAETTTIELRFSRAVLSHKVHYHFVFQPR